MATLQRNPNIEEAPLQNDMMLFNPVSSQFFLLNPTMAYIWRSCQGKDVDALVDGITREFEGADSGNADEDVRQAVAELLSLGLLVDYGHNA